MFDLLYDFFINHVFTEDLFGGEIAFKFPNEVNGYEFYAFQYLSYIASIVSIVVILVLCCLFIYRLIRLVGRLFSGGVL